jgi:hypothetical protein
MKSHPLALSGAEGPALSAVEGPGPAARSDGRVRYSAAVVATALELPRERAYVAQLAVEAAEKALVRLRASGASTDQARETPVANGE